ncbi:receptor-activated Ca2+-permeable cation channel [Viridothelium virens]|uniref:Receptor-activated Ca2+-permeable cation channel n=1 Tax=Viridothelium virens TaxID=1048519 RepID=A0A6A6H7E6_VIRVR|nr:receptor-activated Ca2+-permeable cation channel [Viridothelium virens]
MERLESTRSITEALRQARSREEQETLLGDEEQADDDGCYPPRRDDRPYVENPHAGLPVYMTIQRIRRLVIASIDDPYSPEQLRSPRMVGAVVRPLVDHLYDPDDVSVVYCLLVNRVQFLREQNYQAHHQTVNLTRAQLCEIVASRVLRRFDDENEGRQGLLLLANILVAGFEPFQKAPPEVLREIKRVLPWGVKGHFWRAGYERMLTALEVAIISESKSFLSTAACQKIVDGVYRGRIIYTPTSFIDILPDHYKFRPISLYDPRKAPLLNQYRLVVPRTRNIIEVCQFIILLVLYLFTMVFEYRTGRRQDHLTFSGIELAFCIYAAGWVLDEFASILEHGWKVHTENLWSFLDIAFVAIYSGYFIIRMHGLSMGSDDIGKQALDILCMGAPVLLPRLAFNLMPENMLLISLRAMMADFTFLTLLAGWCFAGFLLSLRWLSNGQHASITISKWMLWIWFGLDGTGIQKSVEMHWLLGPVLFVTFAFLGNTLFLTILVSMLSNTFSKLSANATAEVQFRRAVLTFEGVKSDAIFAYRPPFNILALLLMLPLKFVLSARWFHKINVGAVRFLNAPILLFVSLYERRYLWKKKTRDPSGATKRSWRDMWDFSGFSVHGDLQAVFDIDTPQTVVDELEELDELLDTSIFSNGIGIFGKSRQVSNAGSSAGDVRWRRPRREESVIPAEES